MSVPSQTRAAADHDQMRAYGRLRAWVIKTGEPVPYLAAESGDRLFRAGLMAKTLHTRGHEVTWWTTQFHHQLKTMRNVPHSVPLRPDPEGPEM